jgi:diguanylate cyclase (GGDEF)-like protein/PAS domain S-box-containing protein
MIPSTPEPRQQHEAPPTDPPAAAARKPRLPAKFLLAPPLALSAITLIPEDEHKETSPADRQLLLDISTVAIAAALYVAARKRWRNSRRLKLAAIAANGQADMAAPADAGEADFSSHFASIVEANPDPVVIIAPDGSLSYGNRASRELLGVDQAALQQLSFSALHEHWEDQLSDLNCPSADGGSGPVWRGESSILNLRGESIPVFETVLAHYDAERRLNYWSANLRDIRPEQQIKEALFFQSTHDAQTGLPNLTLFRDQVRQRIANLPSGTPLAVMHISLDHFKQINDSYGYDIGDDILRQAGQRIDECLRQGDCIARISGDEFGLLLHGVGTNAGAGIIAERIFNAMRSPFSVGEYDTYLSICMGLALYPLDADSPDELLRNADIALNCAKRKGRNNLEFYHPAINRQLTEMVNIEAQIRRGIEHEEFALAFQPQVRISDGKLIGMEALLRWRHPSCGLLTPDRFIPVAEESDLIIPLGQWALETACASLASWAALGIDDIHVAVNLSARQFHDPKLLNQVERALARQRLAPERLELEITESTLINDIRSTIDVLNDFNAMGVSIAIDDFGTGYSSLNYLKEFPIDRLKIDRSFVDQLPTDKNDVAITNTIISLAHHLDLQVIAEGVERPEQRQFLLDNGCDEIQGFLFGHPMMDAELMSFLQQGKQPLAA